MRARSLCSLQPNFWDGFCYLVASDTKIIFCSRRHRRSGEDSNGRWVGGSFPPPLTGTAKDEPNQPIFEFKLNVGIIYKASPTTTNAEGHWAPFVVFLTDVMIP